MEKKIIEKVLLNCFISMFSPIRDKKKQAYFRKSKKINSHVFSIKVVKLKARKITFLPFI